MTRTWALVPLKNLAQAKTRLEPAVDLPTRRRLVLAMAEDVLSTLGRVRGIERILLVSNEPEAGSLLSDRSLEVFYTADCEGLNRELEQAAAYAVTRGAERALILHADLPWLSTESVERFIAQCPSGAACAAQDKVGTGTNALLAPLPLPLPLLFGVDSLQGFRAEAKARGVDLHVVQDPCLEQDIDRPEDFERLLAAQHSGPLPGESTRHLLERMSQYRAERTG
jgi:2-phospho-L-lactate guanylyltransferase